MILVRIGRGIHDFSLRLLIMSKYCMLYRLQINLKCSLQQTVWTLIRILLEEQSDLCALCIPKLVLDINIYMQQMTSADNTFRCMYIRRYTSPYENFESGYPHSNALLTFSIQKDSENVLCWAYMSSSCQLHTCQPMKSDVTL